MAKRKMHDPFGVSAPVSVAIHALFILFSLACILPVLLVAIVSLTDFTAFRANGYSFFPAKWSLFAYKYLLSDFGLIANAYGVTAFVCIVGSLLQVVSQSLFAYPLCRKDFPFKGFFSVFILITMLFSGGLAPSYYIYVRVLHIKNTIWSLILPMLGGGYTIFVYRMFYKINIPMELIDAAKIDGASEGSIYARIVLPLSLPILATFSLFGIIGYWNDFFSCLLYIDSTKLYNIQFVMQRSLRNIQFIQDNIRYMGGSAASEMQKITAQLPAETLRMAMAIFGMGPIVLAYPFFQRFFIKGLVVGAIKG
ncbi:MAG: carbohydrate ABC transporter permease [Clostridiales bacterium]|jgi:putative aldouronate transport system permease protein|nr:carbohydrate ABC transporter permease [Clostridiales bacterium]